MAKKVRPHSLGTLIEWKLLELRVLQRYCQTCPQRVGTLIEWKLKEQKELESRRVSPHSLGTLIEWKHFYETLNVALTQLVPTRWGH